MVLDFEKHFQSHAPILEPSSVVHTLTGEKIHIYQFFVWINTTDRKAGFHCISVNTVL